jgi:serine/threonine protein kinase
MWKLTGLIHPVYINAIVEFALNPMVFDGRAREGARFRRGEVGRALSGRGGSDVLPTALTAKGVSGVMLYELATGERPFTGDTPLSTITSILRDTPRPITDLNHELPRDLAVIVRRCLAKVRTSARRAQRTFGTNSTICSTRWIRASCLRPQRARGCHLVRTASALHFGMSEPDRGWEHRSRSDDRGWEHRSRSDDRDQKI